MRVDYTRSCMRVAVSRIKIAVRFVRYFSSIVISIMIWFGGRVNWRNQCCWRISQRNQRKIRVNCTVLYGLRTERNETKQLMIRTVRLGIRVLMPIPSLPLTTVFWTIGVPELWVESLRFTNSSDWEWWTGMKRYVWTNERKIGFIMG